MQMRGVQRGAPKPGRCLEPIGAVVSETPEKSLFQAIERAPKSALSAGCFLKGMKANLCGDLSACDVGEGRTARRSADPVAWANRSMGRISMLDLHCI